MQNSPNIKATALAHTNIALVKYWGKKDDALIIPNTGSLSLTLDQFYTQTTVVFDSKLQRDMITIDGRQADSGTSKKVVTILDLVRNQAQLSSFARITSENHVPISAGLASSASAFAALAGASSTAAGLTLSKTALSRLARRGSGSASRSIFGGFSEWLPGTDDTNSFATPIATNSFQDLRVIAITLQDQPKFLSSREAMKLTVQTSPFYTEWPEIVANDLHKIKWAITQNDFSVLGKISEANALKMHAMMLGATPGFTYFTGATITAMQTVRSLRSHGVECYFTIDAGPNVKILCLQQNVAKIVAAFSDQVRSKNIHIAKSGPEIQIISERK